MMYSSSKGLLWVLLAMGWAWGAHASLFDVSVNEGIPDGDLSGLASTLHLSGLSSPIENLEVGLNISGTFNGDIYAYLTHGSGFSVLLNRVGTTSGNDLGYGDHGLNVIFAENAADIHNYQSALSGSGHLPLSGPLNGTWSPDGRATSPLSATDTDPRSAPLSSFQGLDPNGQWTLFVADVNGGDLHTLNSWSLEVNSQSVSVSDGGNTLVLLLVGVGGVWLIRIRIFSLRWRGGIGWYLTSLWLLELTSALGADQGRSADQDPHATGCLFPTPEQEQATRQTHPRIFRVWPSQLALERMNEERKAKGLPAMPAHGVAPFDDSYGIMTQGIVHVTVSAPAGSGPNIVDLTVMGGVATIHCAGIPGLAYELEASTDLIHWTTVASSTAGANGLFEVVDAQASTYTRRYYRTVAASPGPF